MQTVSLYLDPKGLDAAELECTAFEVSRALRLDEANLLKEFREAQAEKRRFIWVAARLDADQAAKICA